MRWITKTIFWITLLSFIFTVFLFSYKQQLWDYTSPINAERFSNFGTFISSLLGVLTIVLIYLTYKQTQQTQQTTLNTFHQTERNSRDNVFFNLLQTHQNLASHLHQRITPQLKNEYEQLNISCGEPFKNRDDKDFFELMYRMLNLKYKGKNKPRDKNDIGKFFNEQEWIMGHYFRSLLYFIYWIDNNSEFNISSDKKRFFIGFIQAQLTSDEIRLLFYYSISRKEEKEKVEICTTLNKYRFFDLITNFVYQDNNEDWKEFKSILN